MTASFHSLEELRDYVNQTLCSREHLEPNAFPLSERLLVQRDKPCGMYFCLHGPRAVKFTAVWDAVRNLVMFYGATGERFQTTRLMHAPPLATA
jgi:hypothetical protein